MLTMAPFWQEEESSFIGGNEALKRPHNISHQRRNNSSMQQIELLSCKSPFQVEVHKICSVTPNIPAVSAAVQAPASSSGSRREITLATHLYRDAAPSLSLEKQVLNRTQTDVMIAIEAKNVQTDPRDSEVHEPHLIKCADQPIIHHSCKTHSALNHVIHALF